MIERIPEKLGVHESLRDLWVRLDFPVQAATALVSLCQRGASRDLRRRYALKWWGEFLPARVTLCAKTNDTIAGFISDLAARLRGTPAPGWAGTDELLLWQEILALPSPEQRAVLTVLETQASVCTTLVRADLESRYLRGKHDGAEENADDRGRNDTRLEHGDAADKPGLFDRGADASRAADVSAGSAP